VCTLRLCATRILTVFVILRALGGDLIPTAEKGLAALPLMSVRAHSVVVFTFTRTALTSVSSFSVSPKNPAHQQAAPVASKTIC